MAWWSPIAIIIVIVIVAVITMMGEVFLGSLAFVGRCHNAHDNFR